MSPSGHRPFRAFWLLPALWAVWLAVAGCCQLQFEPPGPGVEIHAVYTRQWMTRYLYCPWSEAELAQAEAEWPQLVPPEAEGLRVVVTRPGEQALIFNLPPQGGRVGLPTGSYNMLLYNNGLTTIAVDSLDGWKSAVATTGPGRVPDMLYRCAPHDVRVPGLSVYEARMRPAVWGYMVKFQVSEGLDSVLQASCSVSGMAAGVRLYDGQTLSQTISMTCALEKRDTLQLAGVTRSYGTPLMPSPNIATLVVKFLDGKAASYHFDVTKQLNAQPEGGIIEVQAVRVHSSDAEPEQPETGGFDISVGTWPEPVIIPAQW